MKNCIVGQSGGPTAAINASLCGVYEEAKRLGAPRVYGMRFGIEGLCAGRTVDLDAVFGGADGVRSRALLARTPSSFLGSCRCKLPAPDAPEAAEIYGSIFAQLAQRDIGAFFYIGGNDSMDTIDKLSRWGTRIGSPIRFVGVPKTIDNDLAQTDHTPGYGSAAKYIAASVSEMLCDATVYEVPSVTVVEIMGRDAGWLAAAASLAGAAGGPAPDLVLLPEVPYDEAAFLAELRTLLAAKPGLLVAISEGVRTADGTMLCEMAENAVQQDAFGHRAFLSGAGWHLAARIHEALGCKSRAVELSILQRCASHLASAADLDEAAAAGESAVRAAAAGETGVMIALTRSEGDVFGTRTVPVGQVANAVRHFPREWIAPDGMHVTQEYLRYALPLIQGEAAPVFENGVPVHLHL